MPKSEARNEKVRGYNAVMAPALIIVATLLVLVVFVFLVNGPEDGFGFSILLTIAALIFAPLASRPRSRWARNCRRFAMLIWGLMFYSLYRAASDDLLWGFGGVVCFVVAAVTTFAYWLEQSETTDNQ